MFSCRCWFFSPLLLHCPLEMLTKIGCTNSPCVSLSYSSKLKCFCCHYQERFNICRCIFWTLLCFQQPDHFFYHAVSFFSATRKCQSAHKIQPTCVWHRGCRKCSYWGACRHMLTCRLCMEQERIPKPQSAPGFWGSITVDKMWVLMCMLCKLPIFSVVKTLTCYAQRITEKNPKHPI